nr:response regulator transcription factor [Geobacter hydrogenophilus]
MKQVIAKTATMTIAGEAADGAELLARIRNEEFDVVILDISLPGRSGLEILPEIKTIRPKLPVLILSMHPEEQYALRAMKSGAAGYLTKGSSSQELIEALQKVTMGKKYISPSVAEMLVKNLDNNGERPLHEHLSSREFQVMCRIAGGDTPKKIAEDLMVGIKTVNTYRARILQKMGKKSNADLTRYALEHHLL